MATAVNKTSKQGKDNVKRKASASTRFNLLYQRKTWGIMRFLCTVLLVLGTIISSLAQAPRYKIESIKVTGKTYMQSEIDSLDLGLFAISTVFGHDIKELQGEVDSLMFLNYAITELMVKLSDDNVKLKERLDKLEGNTRQTMYKPFHWDNKIEYIQYGNH